MIRGPFMEQKDIAKILMYTKDQASELNIILDLLYLLQQNRGPLIEVVTVLKFEKPLLYSLLKRRVVNPGLKMLFQLSLDYEYAKTSIYGEIDSP
jgi:hypothetical protein